MALALGPATMAMDICGHRRALLGWKPTLERALGWIPRHPSYSTSIPRGTCAAAGGLDVVAAVGLESAADGGLDWERLTGCGLVGWWLILDRGWTLSRHRRFPSLQLRTSGVWEVTEVIVIGPDPEQRVECHVNLAPYTRRARRTPAILQAGDLGGPGREPRGGFHCRGV